MRLSILFIAFVLPIFAMGQIDADSLANSQASEPDMHIPSVELKPRLGFAMGPMILQGDIARNNPANNLANGRPAYTLSISNELNSFLTLDVFTTFGRIQVADLSNDQPLLYQSLIRSGGARIQYNFDHFLSSQRGIEPYISIGFQGIEFLNKADMRDANGDLYHYWSDGTVRNIAENSVDADQSMLTQIDGVYETDLREANLDGFGRYSERTFGIPVGIGAQFLMTKRVKAHFGASMVFTTSDLLDGRTADSQGSRKGNARNDRLFMASVGINYDLNITPKARPQQGIQYLDENGMLVTANTSDDSDGDGVDDFQDRCAGTPAGATVDEFGCPVDSDGDGYADCYDEEPDSPHTYVDKHGVALDDDYVYERFLMWNDSIPWETEVWKEDFAKKESDPTHWSNTYSVQVGAESEGLSQAQINAILSLNDITSIEENGERIYLAGQFENLPEAVERKLELEIEGFEGAVVKQSPDQPVTTVTEEARALENEMRASMASAHPTEGTVFRIQLGAFRNPLSSNIFSDVEDLIILKGEDGLTRYMSGSFKSLESAAQVKVDLLMDGFEGAFITAYADGSRITLAEAGARVRNEAQDLTYDVENTSVDPTLVSFRIQLGVFDDEIPTETLDQFLALGNVKHDKTAEGMRYYTQCCSTLMEAEEKLEEVLDIGVVDAFIIGEFNGEIISLEDAQTLKNSEPVTTQR